MLADKYLPREFREYARLAKHIGMQDWLSGAAGRLDLDDPWVRHYFDYLTGTPRAEPTSR